MKFLPISLFSALLACSTIQGNVGNNKYGKYDVDSYGFDKKGHKYDYYDEDTT
jgi:hypothetical protein